MSARRKYVILFAITGFLVGEALCGYAFYLTSHHRIGSAFLFLTLCPTSLGAMALDNAGVIGGVIGWLFISLENAVLYGLIGFGIGKLQSRSSPAKN
jgi:hypothetical protein